MANDPRRAAARSTVILARVALGATAAALTLTLGALAVVISVARKVVRPTPRRADLRVLDVNVPAQTITLERTADSVLPGRYGLFTFGETPGYLKLGAVLGQDAHSVTRKLLTQVDADAQMDDRAAFSGWYYNSPDQLQLPYRPELVPTALGPAPAWIFEGNDTWVLQVHGRGAQRAETLRAVPTLHALGVTNMVVSYRNDGEAPRSENGMYGLGATEWRDIDAAISLAVKSGAKRIVLMGWSMGGAIALQTAALSAQRDRIVGVILESPVIDWRSVLDYQADMLRVPRAVGGLAIATLQHGWSAKAAGSTPIPFDQLDMVRHAATLAVPTLILHSDDDGFVPAEASHALAEARPDLVDMQTFTVARHTKLWNYDQQRWEDAITEWMRAHHFAQEP